MKRILQDISVNKNSGQLEELPDDVILPLTSMENVDELERKLEDKRLQAILVRFLSTLYVHNKCNINAVIFSSYLISDAALSQGVPNSGGGHDPRKKSL